jgi:hypothetical protein
MADPLQQPADLSDWCPPRESEHFWWKPQEHEPQDVEWFYNEVTVERSAPMTFYMATGWAGGYFGIQDHGGRKIAIFSVWDQANMVEIVDWGEDVLVGRFGAEGTGANSMMQYNWTIGETVRFLLHAKVEDPTEPGAPKSTVYSGYIHDVKLSAWKLLSRLRVRPCGQNEKTEGHFIGFNSFIEIWHRPKRPHCNGTWDERRARYGPAWYRSQGSNSFKQFRKLQVTATCDPCPETGLGFEELDGGLSFAMELGPTRRSDTLPHLHQERPVGEAVVPSILVDSPLPDGDNSPAGRWDAGEKRPLKHWGDEMELTRWGSGNTEPTCPWYVVDCGDAPTHAERQEILR